MHEVMMHVNKNANCNHKNHEFFTIMPTIKEFTTKNAFKIATSISVPNFWLPKEYNTVFCIDFHDFVFLKS